MIYNLLFLIVYRYQDEILLLAKFFYVKKSIVLSCILNERNFFIIIAIYFN